MPRDILSQCSVPNPVPAMVTEGVGDKDGSRSGLSQTNVQGIQGPSMPSQDMSSRNTVNKVVSFDDIVDRDDVESVTQGNSDPSFKEVAQLVFNVNPQSAPQASTSQARTCDFEGMFAPSSKESRALPKFNIFHKVSEIFDETKAKCLGLAAQGKPLINLLPNKKRKYEPADVQGLATAPPLNHNIGRLMTEHVPGKRSLCFSYDEASKVESLNRHQLEMINHSFWLLSTVLKLVKEGGFEPQDPSLFDALIYSLTLSIVNNLSVSSSLASYFQLKRREGYLSHFPLHVAPFFRQELLSSPLDSSVLFDPSVFDRIVREVKDDSSTSASVRIASLPSFSALRASRKASSGGVAVEKDQAVSSFGRGRGRGFQKQGQSVSRLGKRKASSSPSPGPSSKSPRKGAPSPRGRGFPA